MQPKINLSSPSLFRFIACIIVILFHCSMRDVSGNSTLLKYMQLMFPSGPHFVTFFFVLSGYSLLLSYYNKPVSLKGFFTKRLSRIAPVYFIALITAVTFFYLTGNSNLNALGVIANIFFLQSWLTWLAPYSFSINHASWFVSDIVSFYASFPVILHCLKKFKPSPWRFMILAMAIWLGTQIVHTILLNSPSYQGFPSGMFFLIHHFPLSHFCSFLLGVAMGYVVLNKPFPSIPAWIPCCLLILCLQNESVISRLSLPFGASLYAPVFMFIVYSLSTCNIKVLSSRPLVVLGEMSFCTYIMQDPFYLVYYSFTGFIASYDMRLLGYVMLLLFIGAYLYFFVDKPLKKLFIRRVPDLKQIISDYRFSHS